MGPPMCPSPIHAMTAMTTSSTSASMLCLRSTIRAAPSGE